MYEYLKFYFWVQLFQGVLACGGDFAAESEDECLEVRTS